jgi:DNA-binding transcriptional ArsR family regulator
MIEPDMIPMAAARFKALGDAVRLTLLAALQEGERSVGELALATRRNQPNVSQQLASLARAGLVESRRDGNRVLYRSADPFVARICETVCASLTRRLRAEEQRMKALRHAGPRRRWAARG